MQEAGRIAGSTLKPLAAGVLRSEIPRARITALRRSHMLHVRRSSLVLSSTVTVLVLGLATLGGHGAAHSLGDSIGDPNEQRIKTRFYFMRHAEDLEESVLKNAFEPVCTGPCCLEVLNDLGTLRAELLVRWFKERDILPRLTHVVASHKVRTLQTVEPLAAAAAEAGAQLAEDVDLHPEDAVQQVPAFVEECAPGFEGSASSRAPMIEHLKSIPAGSTVVVAAHSPTLYPILQAFGVDTSDPVDFPIDARGRVSGFNNVWIVDVDESGQGELKKHWFLDFELTRRPR
jgi:phosphohistidine phosphatase SixA